MLRSVLTANRPGDVYCLIDISSDVNTVLDNDSIVERAKTMKMSSAFNLVASYIEVIGKSKNHILSSESIALLRLLLGDPEWAATIYDVIIEDLSAYDETTDCIHDCISSLGVLGARIESM